MIRCNLVLVVLQKALDACVRVLTQIDEPDKTRRLDKNANAKLGRKGVEPPAALSEPSQTGQKPLNRGRD